MSGPAWRVPRADAEAVRRELSRAGCLAPGVRAERTGEFVVFPLLRAPEAPPTAGQLIAHDFPPPRAPAPRRYADLLAWPEEERRRLPRSFDVVGDVVLVRIPEALRGRSEEIGEALLAFVPGARLVGRDEGVQGVERRRRLVRIAGAGAWRTRHRENGLDLAVDLEAAYFSPRLGREHARVAAAVRPGERVYDLCCGIGPFALAIAASGRARQVVAVDLNPSAIALLRENAERLGLADRVRPVLASLETFLPDAGPAERVVLNLPHEGIKYLASVGAVVARAGALHYYEVTARSEAGAPARLLTTLGAPGAWQLADRHVVHPYSPRSDLVAYELRRGEG